MNRAREWVDTNITQTLDRSASFTCPKFSSAVKRMGSLSGVGAITAEAVNGPARPLTLRFRFSRPVSAAGVDAAYPKGGSPDRPRFASHRRDCRRCLDSPG